MFESAANAPTGLWSHQHERRDQHSLDCVRDILKQDPELLFCAGDQINDLKQHTATWTRTAGLRLDVTLPEARQFGDWPRSIHLDG